MKKQVTSWHAIGAQIAHFRKYVGMTQTELADRLNVSHDKMASIEQGRRPLRMPLAVEIDELLDTKGALAVGVSKIPAREKYPVVVADLVEYEEKARAILSYETLTVPGLLQTPEYMRASHAYRYPPLADETVDDWVTGRLERQLMWEREHPPWCTFILEESILHRPVGGREVMQGQIRRLLTLGELPFIGVQIMPLGQVPHAGLSGPMKLLQNADNDFVVYLEGQGGSSVIEDPDEASVYLEKYGMLRSQALSPTESTRLLDGLLGAS
ncbi:helix-turn-helix transcriptional regulator [Streptomyces sp. NPDC052225]|uniref:helix-turn-helix domain-containing protein n=1 Tax=Streptomyces sp. NPDC052225 TaxID=3154949 RepID=UPI003448688E